ncbi:unnamed protein product [Caenorhabditis angaria]|uniref:Uncharacterized protein n=1 Tax=Caenorhabditis angaria TaxID=860376 RepID=A0A9P1J110_9PELO|nr:unnamed protein product [Caenorhabditis angaria]
MRIKWPTILLIALITLVFLLFNIYGVLEILRFFRSQEQKKVLEFQHRNRLSTTSTSAPDPPPPELVTFPSSTSRSHHHHKHHKTNHISRQHVVQQTTQEPEPVTETSTSTTTRIHITTPRYQVATEVAVPVIERIKIPASSSYREPYRYHQEHKHNRTHIEVHRHVDSTTTVGTTTSTTVGTTTSRSHHHHHHHRHNHHMTSNTERPTPPRYPTREYPPPYRAEVQHRPHSQHPTNHPPRPTDGYWRYPQGSIRAGLSRQDPTTTSTLPSTTNRILDENDIEYDPISFEVGGDDQDEDQEETTTERSTTTTEKITTTTTEWAGRRRQPEPTTTPGNAAERNVTIVTGLLNIGRGDWDQYRRPLTKYHEFMENLLSLQNNLVVFTDDSSYDFVEKYRAKLGLAHMTRVHKISIQELPLYGYYNEAKRIIDNELGNATFYELFADSDMKTHPEAKSAEYNIVVNSKTHFLQNVTLENPFQTDHFIWLDAGYGHGNQSVFPYNNIWRPKFVDGKVSLIKLTPHYDKLTNYGLHNLYRRNWAVLSGGFIAGDKHSIEQLHSIIHRRFIRLIYQNYVDDDQTLLVLAVNAHPHLFNIVNGDWFDAFKLFSVDAESQLG